MITRNRTKANKSIEVQVKEEEKDFSPPNITKMIHSFKKKSKSQKKINQKVKPMYTTRWISKLKKKKFNSYYQTIKIKICWEKESVKYQKVIFKIQI